MKYRVTPALSQPTPRMSDSIVICLMSTERGGAHR